MADNELELLKRAISRNAAAVLSLPSAGMLRHHKSRLLAELDGGILLECPVREMPLLADLISQASLVGISFRSGQTKVIFSTVAQRVVPQWAINASTRVDALMVAMPTKIHSQQRRSDYRVFVREGIDITARVWRMAPRTTVRDRVLANQEVQIKVHNLSLGGMGVTFIGKGNQPPMVCTEDRLRVQIAYQQQELLLEARMRAPSVKHAGNTITTGIGFKKLQNDMDGRRVLAQLTRIVGEMQRLEARRFRQGVA